MGTASTTLSTCDKKPFLIQSLCHSSLHKFVCSIIYSFMHAFIHSGNKYLLSTVAKTGGGSPYLLGSLWSFLGSFYFGVVLPPIPNLQRFFGEFPIDNWHCFPQKSRDLSVYEFMQPCQFSIATITNYYKSNANLLPYSFVSQQSGHNSHWVLLDCISFQRHWGKIHFLAFSSLLKLPTSISSQPLFLQFQSQ